MRFYETRKHEKMEKNAQKTAETNGPVLNVDKEFTHIAAEDGGNIRGLTQFCFQFHSSSLLVPF